MPFDSSTPRGARNVLGGPLAECGTQPLTGFFRNGCCHTSAEDIGRHVVCAKMTAAFLEFSRKRGNDLSTPQPAYGFPGLKPDDRWCLCAARWQEAFEAGVPPMVRLAATHVSALEYSSLADLRSHAIDA